jgi:N-methylhydantoinase B
VIDPLTLAVVKSALEQALDEVLTTFERLAFSPVISEGHDYGVGLYARDTGDLLAVDRAGFPLFVWLGEDAVRAVIAVADADELRPGDVFLLNDPYLSGTHMHDVKAVAPVLWRGELVCFVCVTGHWSDIGGPSPGGFATNATEVHQEGLRIPPLKIVADGVLDENLVAMIRNNVRMPDTTIGDLFAQLASVQLGQERIGDLLERFGSTTLLQATAAMAEAGEAQMRERITAIPDGTYAYRDCLDNDGNSFDPVWIDVRLTVAGSDLTIDFSASDPPVRGAFNAPRLTTVAASRIALLHAFPDVLLTHGAARPITVVAGPEVFVGAEFPRACEAYGEVSSRIMDTVLGALWQAVPERARGGICGTSSNLAIGGDDPGRGPFIMYAYLGGGQGGAPDGDGLTNGPTAIGVALTPQIETFEHAYPVLYREYAIREGSGGLGEHRGGLGVAWEVELLRGEATMSAMADRATRGPAGVGGGQPGAPNVYEVIRADGGVELLPHLTKCENVSLRPGDRIRRLSPGGGGAGPLASRDSVSKEADLRAGYYTTADYGEAEARTATPVRDAEDTA